LKNPLQEWVEPQPVEIPRELMQITGGHSLLAKALVRRGIGDPNQVKAFLDPAYYRPLSPQELPDLAQAVDRLQTAIKNREQIGIWGDFDVDGQTATTLLLSSLEQLGANVCYHIPIRSIESHGVHPQALVEFLKQGIQLLITCDTGITAHEAIKICQKQGVDVLITDHHTLPPELPSAQAVVNPQRLPQTHPLYPLCGVGVAWKVVEELYQRNGRMPDLENNLDLVALGTIADLAALNGENRYLVQRGLKILRESKRPALQAMLESAEIQSDHLSENHVSFILAPRLNAIGRLDDANPVVQFLTTKNITDARLFAAKLEGLNARRKLLCDQVFASAQAQIERAPGLLNNPALILEHPEWPAGVIGIVASRLAELYHLPVILFSTPPGQIARGSARSVEGINITQAISEHQELLVGFGGHPMAAGLSIKTERIPQFRRALLKNLSLHYPAVFPSQKLVIDDFVELFEITPELAQAMEQLSPFGPGNPPVLLATRNLILKSYTPIGKNKEHLLLTVEDTSGTFHRVIWWQGANSELPSTRFDLAFTARMSNYRGQSEVQLEWVAARTIESAPYPLAPKQFVQVIDLRQESVTDNLIKAYLEEPDALLWREGELTAGPPGIDRYHLTPCRTLIIWSTPPCQDVLESILQISSPQRVILLNMESTTDHPQAFLTRLASLILHAIKTNQTRLDFCRLATATCQRESVVELGVKWLAAKGFFTIELMSDSECSIIPGGQPNPVHLSEIEHRLKYLLQETKAYRAYYARAEAQLLVGAAMIKERKSKE